MNPVGTISSPDYYQNGNFKYFFSVVGQFEKTVSPALPAYVRQTAKNKPFDYMQKNTVT